MAPSDGFPASPSCVFILHQLPEGSFSTVESDGPPQSTPSNHFLHLRIKSESFLRGLVPLSSQSCLVAGSHRHGALQSLQARACLRTFARATPAAWFAIASLCTSAFYPGLYTSISPSRRPYLITPSTVTLPFLLISPPSTA